MGFIHIQYTFCILVNYLRSLFTIFLFPVVIFLWVISVFGNKFTLVFSITWAINLTLSTLRLEFVSLYSHGLFLFISEWMKNLESEALIPTQSILDEEQSHSMKLERYIWDDPWFSRLEVLGCKDQLEMYHVNQSTAMRQMVFMQKQILSQRGSEFCELGAGCSQSLSIVPSQKVSQVEHFYKPDVNAESWRCNSAVMYTDKITCENNEYDKAFYQSMQPVHPARVQTGDNLLKCTDAVKSFNHILHFGDHMGMHTGERLYEYKECHQIFNKSPSFNEHPGIHFGGNQYDYKEYENIHVPIIKIW